VTAVLWHSASAGETEKVLPAQFKSEGSFSGGKELPGCVLTGIRFGKHSDFLRVVFDFSVDKGGGVRADASWHPPYRFSYKKYPYRIKVEFGNVKYAPNAVVQSKDAIPLSIVTTPDDTIRLVELFVNQPVMFKVIEVDDPAKLSLDLKVKPDEEIPQVYAVQIKGINGVEDAFRILDEGKFPPGIDPDILVIGNAFFVEAVFTTLAEAVDAAAALEKNGYTTIITERKGNELPTP